jgi:DNA-directed RNA polymerase subunit RPC12/RpoP
MKIQGFRIYLHPLVDHKCPECGEKVERRPRRLWQKLLSIALPLRHYKCTVCYHHFFAFSPSWKQTSSFEKILRLLATATILLAGVFIVLRIIYAVFFEIMV